MSHSSSSSWADPTSVPLWLGTSRCLSLGLWGVFRLGFKSSDSLRLGASRCLCWGISGGPGLAGWSSAGARGVFAPLPGPLAVFGARCEGIYRLGLFLSAVSVPVRFDVPAFPAALSLGAVPGLGAQQERIAAGGVWGGHFFLRHLQYIQAGSEWALISNLYLHVPIGCLQLRLGVPHLDTRLYVDHGPEGIASTVAQHHQEGDNPGWKAVHHKSRSLVAAELNYSKPEGESLAIYSGIKMNSQYLYGTQFTVMTDHYALPSLYNTTRPAPHRVERHRGRLRNFQFTVHVPGNKHPCDYGSRHPEPLPPNMTREEMEDMGIETEEADKQTKIILGAWATSPLGTFSLEGHFG